MSWMKSIKCTKGHHFHTLSVMWFWCMNIHGIFMVSLLLFMCDFFLVISIEFEKFFFKYFFKKSFLWTYEEINKDTKWGQKKHNQNRENLEYHRTCTIANILCYPYHNTKPNNKDVEYKTSHNKIEIKLIKNI